MYRSVAECYDGQSVFMTGCTGFLGKVVLEKLLYSCPGIDKIYLLVREKQDVTPQERVQKILEQPLFLRLKQEKPESLKKIITIAGDISEPQLGINAEDEKLLADNVSIVFHVAAAIKFNEPLEKAVNINVSGTERVLNLSKQMNNMKAFVYVSTVYSNVDKKVIDETVYPPPASLSDIKKMIEVGISEKQTEELIEGRPNTYTFTKALAENLVADNHGNIPAVIVRPSIVTASKTEPTVGWIDNWFGATALATAIMKGFNRIMLSKPDNNLDLIPVDYVSNLIVVAAARCKSSTKVDVYNTSTSTENPISMKQFTDLIIADSYKHKFYDVPMPMILFTEFKWVLILMTFLMQTLPAYIADMLMLLSGKKARFVKIQNKTVIVRDILAYFTTNNWMISTKRTRALANSLSPSDRSLFPCDPADIDWNQYVPIYCQGIRQYLCKTR